jgi:hypothetical protein
MAIVVDVASRRCLPMVSDGADGPGLAAASSHLIRFVYSVRSEKVTHHNASFQVFPAGADHCRVVWIADLLPMKRQRVSGR